MTAQAAPVYHRVPLALGAPGVSVTGNVRADEAEYLNDGDFPIEVHGISFSIAGAQAGTPVQSPYDVGVNVSGPGGLAWMPKGVYARLGLLGRITGNATEGADMFAFSGTRWNFRHPLVLTLGARLDLFYKRFPSETITTDAVLHGSLLRPLRQDDDPRLLRQYDRWVRAMPWPGLLPPDIASRPEISGVTPRAGYELRPSGASEPIAYTWIPRVVSSTLTTTSAAPVRLSDADFRNESRYDWRIYAIAVGLAEMFDGTPTQGLRDLSIQVFDLARRQSWSKRFQRVAALMDHGGSIMGIGQGGVWHGVRWDMGPGVVLPPASSGEVGSGLRVSLVNNIAATSIDAEVCAIGEQLVPVWDGTAEADALRAHLAAVPTW